MTEPHRVPGRLAQLGKRARTTADMPRKYLAWQNGWEKGNFFPNRVYIESTNHCNLKCVMCPTGLGIIQRPRGYMDIGLYRDIVAELGPVVDSAILHSWGEPLMHPNLFEMIQVGRAAGIQMETSTNITLLDERRARGVLESELDVIYLALDGTTPETYERVRVNAKWDKVIANVERFLDLKARTGAKTRVVLQIIAMDATRAEVDEFVRRWQRPEVDQVNVKHLDTWGDQIEAVSGRQIDGQSRSEQRLPCPNLWYHGYIFWDGSLTSCERDYDIKTPLGNVKDGGVLRTWHGPAMQQLRRLHCQGDFQAPACTRCVEWSWWKPSPFGSAGTAPRVESFTRKN